MVSIESEPLARPRRLPPDHSCEKRERLLVVEQKNIFSAPKEVWVIAPPVGVLCQHIKREYLCRQRSQHYRHSLVLRPSSHAGWQPPAAEIQPNAVLGQLRDIGPCYPAVEAGLDFDDKRFR